MATQKEIIKNGGTPAGFCKGIGKGFGHVAITCKAGPGNCSGYKPTDSTLPATCGNCEYWYFAGFGEY